MAAMQLTRTHRILVGVVVTGAVIIAGIGFTGSYAAVRELAEQKGFGRFSLVFPIGIDAGICVLLALDLLLTWIRIPFPLLRQAAWILTAATIAFNGAAAWPDPLGVGMHGVIPLLFIVAVEAARHAVGRIADITADKHMEGVRLTRWLLSPIPTFMLWRRMKLWELRSYEQVIKLEQDRLIYQSRLQARFGRNWRRKAPIESMMPLRLAKYGVPLADTAAAGLSAAGIEPMLLPPGPAKAELPQGQGAPATGSPVQAPTQAPTQAPALGVTAAPAPVQAAPLTEDQIRATVQAQLQAQGRIPGQEGVRQPVSQQTPPQGPPQMEAQLPTQPQIQAHLPTQQQSAAQPANEEQLEQMRAAAQTQTAAQMLTAVQNQAATPAVSPWFQAPVVDDGQYEGAYDPAYDIDPQQVTVPVGSGNRTRPLGGAPDFTAPGLYQGQGDEQSYNEQRYGEQYEGPHERQLGSQLPQAGGQQQARPDVPAQPDGPSAQDEQAPAVENPADPTRVEEYFKAFAKYTHEKHDYPNNHQLALYLADAFDITDPSGAPLNERSLWVLTRGFRQRYENEQAAAAGEYTAGGQEDIA